jgi:hypothetical protein
MIEHALAALLALAAPAAGGLRTVTAVATDEKGQPVTGLSAEDVALVQGGAALELTEMVYEDRPLTLALLVDTSAPVGTSLRLNVVPAVTDFLKRLPRGARIVLWSTGDRPTRLVAETDEIPAVVRALERTPTVGGNRLLDALVEAARELKKKEGARTAVVVVTGEGPGFTDFDRQTVVDIARQGGALFEAVTYHEGAVAPAQVPAMNSDSGEVSLADYSYVLSNLAEQSGGRNDQVLSAMGVGTGLERIAADLAGQYRLTYRPREGAKGALEVSVARPGVKVHLGKAR